jgi:hypothetical protein
MTNCRDDFICSKDREKLESVRDLFLGPAKDLTSNAPIPDPARPGKLIGGTAFERCGQRAVKDSGRCYSLTMTHQRQRALVGPTSFGKVYNNTKEADEETYLNLEIRERVTEVRNRYSIFRFYVDQK